ncbi:MAG: class I SAM-dependent methyltransferase [Nitrospiria bacterium]
MKKKAAKKLKEVALLKIDFGCGKNPREGFQGADIRDFGQPFVFDLRKKWPWADGSIEEAHTSHFLEHLTAEERIHFVNELYRCLKLGGKCQVITPHWASARAYGDLTHKWPPVSEMWFHYLNKVWREANAPHNDEYNCDFLVTWGYTLHPSVVPRNQEYQLNALNFYKEAAQDTMATFTKQ